MMNMWIGASVAGCVCVRHTSYLAHTSLHRSYANLCQSICVRGRSHRFSISEDYLVVSLMIATPDVDPVTATQECCPCLRYNFL